MIVLVSTFVDGTGAIAIARKGFDTLFLLRPMLLLEPKLQPATLKLLRAISGTVSLDMALPKEYRAYRRTIGDLPNTIELSTEKLPDKLGANDVVIKIRAVSLNYRDPAMLHGTYPAPFGDRGIPVSDCAAEVVATGPAVKDFTIGDRVAPIFNVSAITGIEDEPMQGLGGEVPGTGGVSMFALILCQAAGITTIITSSSDDKLAQIKKTWPKVQGINYKTSNQETEIARITDSKGVDVVVNNSGVASLITDLKSLRTRGGVVSLVGFLGGMDAKWDPREMFNILFKNAILKGINVGSKGDYQLLNKFIEEHKISLKPLLDRTFSFEESAEAFNYLYSGKHVGKVIIEL
nr:zinc-type alcohol dehydrogenase-like protein [Quercus suber]